MLKIYISGKYSAPTYDEIEHNIAVAEAIAAQIWQSGHGAFCPHMNTRHFECLSPVVAYDLFMAYDLAMVEVHDVIVMLPGWQNSVGAMMEYQHAKKHGKHVIEWTGIEDFNKAIRGWLFHKSSLNMGAIHYKQGYKYQLVEDIRHSLPAIFKPFVAATDYVMLSEGLLTIRKGYAWNGATGALDTATFMKPSLIHDALYKLIRTGHLPEMLRIEADKELKDLCLKSGMTKMRATYVYWFVRLFGQLVNKEPKILEAK